MSARTGVATVVIHTTTFAPRQRAIAGFKQPQIMCVGETRCPRRPVLPPAVITVTAVVAIAQHLADPPVLLRSDRRRTTRSPGADGVETVQVSAFVVLRILLALRSAAFVVLRHRPESLCGFIATILQSGATTGRGHQSHRQDPLLPIHVPSSIECEGIPSHEHRIDKQTAVVKAFHGTLPAKTHTPPGSVL